MEFHDLGKQCSFPQCKQLDFLPFPCAHCRLVFCKEHYLPRYHDCTASDLQSDNLQNIESTNSYFTCSDSNCTVTSAVALLCAVCKQHFCVSHRHHGCLDKPPTEEEIKRWNTPREQFAAAKSKVDHQVSSSLREKANKKNNVTAIKIQLMKLKGRAKGPNVPISERSYFLVYPPSQCSMSSQAVFVGQQWTLGRVIDSVADSCKVPNRNNEATAPKLRIFSHVNGQMLGPITQTIQNLFHERILHDGSSLVLEYVPGDNVENDSLINVALYKE